MKRKKGKFWTLVCSFLPGAAEMYMGFMKNGISILAVFFASLIIPSVLSASDVFVLLAALVWFYGFFHARNLAACSEEELQEISDTYIWESWGDFGKLQIPDTAIRKWGAVFLIICGISSLWNTISRILFDALPDHVWEQIAPVFVRIPEIAAALIFIAAGFRLMAGKKEELDGEGE